MTTAPRRPLVVGNWKMHKTVAESVAFARELRDVASPAWRAEVMVAPVFTSLYSVGESLRGSAVGLAAQNVHDAPSGAFTGEVSASQLADVGCTHVILGHSERRQLFRESDDAVRRKIAALLVQDLGPIVCVGETLAERHDGRALAVVLGQVDAALDGLDERHVAKLVVAYEPVWAIGTGHVCPPEDAQEMHAAIRVRVREHGGPSVADALRILYGGSVKPDNAGSLLSQPDIDGALVGGASLDVASFVAIARAAE